MLKHWFYRRHKTDAARALRPNHGARLWQAVEAALSSAADDGAPFGNLPPGALAGNERPLLESCLAKRAQLDETHRDYLRIWVQRGDPAEADFAAGKLWEWLDRPNAAEQAYRACLARLPGHAKANNQLGLLLLEREAWDEAIACFGRAVEADAKCAAFRNNLGIGLWQVGELEDAFLCYSKAWQIDPDNPEIRRNLFKAAMEEDRLDIAEQVVAAALAGDTAGVAEPAASADRLGMQAEDPIWPQAAQAALVLQSGDLEKAEILYRELMTRNEVAGLTGLGMVAVSHGRFEEAAACFERVVGKAPGNPAAFHNLAIARSGHGDLGAALECIDRALCLVPKDPNFLLMRSMIYLQTGRWKEGWRDYEARLRFSEQLAATVGFDNEALWQGESLSGKTLAIVGEQGAGDQIQFARFASEAAKRGAEVVVYCNQASLKRLIEGVPGVARVCIPGEPFIPYDYWVAMLSLPRLLGIEGESLAPQIPYLFVDKEVCRRWGERLAEVRGLKVGVVWGGSPMYGKGGGDVDRRRSLPLVSLAPLWHVPGNAFFSLQKGEPRKQLADFARTHAIVDYSDEWADFADTAAFISALDLVISVDTSVAHLAGGLGKPVWILSRHDACWRWLENREDSPWYPTARIFRQSLAEGWGPVVGRVADALLDFKKMLD